MPNSLTPAAPGTPAATTPAGLLVRLVDIQDPTALIAPIKGLWEQTATRERAWRESAVMMGVVMIAAKSRLAHGEFGPWLAEHVFAIEKRKRAAWNASGDWRKCQRYMQAATRALAESGVTLTEIADWPLDSLIGAGELGPDRTAQLDRIREAVAGRTLGQLMLPWAGEAGTPGGFHVSNAAVTAWLAKHHPEVKATTYDALSPELQEAFRKQWKPKVSAAERIRMAQAQCAAVGKHLREFSTTKPKPWTRLEDPERVALAKQLRDLAALVEPKKATKAVTTTAAAKN